MNGKTQKAYNEAVSLIGDLPIKFKLGPGEYADLIGELSAHLQCLQDCIDEENKAEE